MAKTEAQYYLDFAAHEARGQSRVYDDWATHVAGDPVVLALVETLPPVKRQPNLVFAAARWHGVPTGPYAALRATLLERWPEVAQTILGRATQTNEAARCAQLVPVLAALSQPLALVEVGASAGLTLLPDRYSYEYRCDDGTLVRLDPTDGPSEVVIESRLSGIRPPEALPEVVWRAGVDLAPVDARDSDARAWLETLVWPGEDERLARLQAALDLAAREPVRIVRGDLLDQTAGLVEQAPSGATVVVYHSAVLVYLDDGARERFRDLVTSLPCHWISNEGTTVFPETAAPFESSRPAGPGQFLMALDGQPVGWAQGHGRAVTWIA